MVLKNRNKKISSKKKRLLIAAILIVVVALAVGGVIYFKHKSSDTPQSTSTKLENELGKQRADAKNSSNTSKPATTTTTNKQALTKQATGDSQTAAATPAAANVTPYITFFGKNRSGQAEVDAFVPGIVENGTCTLTITDGSTTITSISKPALANAQSTRCEIFLVDGSGASSSWRAVVSYSSAAHSGSSQSTPLQN